MANRNDRWCLLKKFQSFVLIYHHWRLQEEKIIAFRAWELNESLVCIDDCWFSEEWEFNKTFFSAFPKWCFIWANYLVSVTHSCRLRCSRRLRTYKPGPVSWVRFGLVRLGKKGNCDSKWQVRRSLFASSSCDSTHTLSLKGEKYASGQMPERLLVLLLVF